MKLIGLAGSNIAYIGMVLTGTPFGKALSYHNQVFDHRDKGKGRFQYFHDMTKDDSDVKIIFDDQQEIIVLNWQVKFRLHPDSDFNTKEGDVWSRSQYQIWKDFGSLWETRAVLQWTHSLHDDQHLRSTSDYAGSIFDGQSLYKGFTEARAEFSKFGIDYTQQDYNDWRHSQGIVFGYIEQLNDVTEVGQVDSLPNDVLKGIALGRVAKNNGLSDDNVWERYIK
jgi:hypothetical protein